ncbi:hypothetical protein Tco_0807759 [Tanacetum coccineum]
MSYCSTAVEVLVYKGLRLVEVGVPTSRYVVPTGRVIATVSIKVPTGREQIPAFDFHPSHPSHRNLLIIEEGEDCQHVKWHGD